MHETNGEWYIEGDDVAVVDGEEIEFLHRGVWVHGIFRNDDEQGARILAPFISDHPAGHLVMSEKVGPYDPPAGAGTVRRRSRS